jgi:gluconokinase
MLTVFSRGDRDVINARIMTRGHKFKPPSLLRTQFDDLQKRQADEPAVTVDIAETPSKIVEQAPVRLSNR